MKEPLFEPYCILLHRRRREMGFSVRGLAILSGVSPSYISDIETGRRDANDKQLQLLLAALYMKYADIEAHDCRPPVHEIRELCQTDKRLGVAFRAIVTAIKMGRVKATDIIAMLRQKEEQELPPICRTCAKCGNPCDRGIVGIEVGDYCEGYTRKGDQQ